MAAAPKEIPAGLPITSQDRENAVYHEMMTGGNSRKHQQQNPKRNPNRMTGTTLKRLP